MMGKEINVNQVGLTLAIVSGLLHLLWIIVVGIGLGQLLVDFGHSVHFLSSVHSVGSFNFGTALLLLFLAVVWGYVLGLIFALVWNWSGKKIK